MPGVRLISRESGGDGGDGPGPLGGVFPIVPPDAGGLDIDAGPAHGARGPDLVFGGDPNADGVAYITSS